MPITGHWSAYKYNLLVVSYQWTHLPFKLENEKLYLRKECQQEDFFLLSLLTTPNPGSKLQWYLRT